MVPLFFFGMLDAPTNISIMIWPTSSFLRHSGSNQENQHCEEYSDALGQKVATNPQ